MDPGKDGFATLLSADGVEIVESVPVPLLPGGGYDRPGMFRLAQRWRGRVALALIERQIAMPDQDPRSTMTIGEGVGLWVMSLIAADIPYEDPPPAEWKDILGITAPRAAPGTRPPNTTGLGPKELRRRAATLRRAEKEGQVLTPEDRSIIDTAKATSNRSADRRKTAKALAVAKALAMFPSFDFRASTRCRVPHDGRCESALLAVVAARRWRGREDIARKRGAAHG